VELLVPGCRSTGPLIFQIGTGNAAGRVRNIFEKNESSKLILLTKLYLVGIFEFLVESLFKLLIAVKIWRFILVQIKENYSQQ
jgi:hypothetical protein